MSSNQAESKHGTDTADLESNQTTCKCIYQQFDKPGVLLNREGGNFFLVVLIALGLLVTKITLRNRIPGVKLTIQEHT